MMAKQAKRPRPMIWMMKPTRRMALAVV